MTRSRLVLVRLLLTGYWCGLLVVSHWPLLDFSRPEANPAGVAIPNQILPFGLDKWLHVGAYFGLAVLAILAFHRPNRRDRGAATGVVAILVVLGYSVFDELTQTFIGREVTWSDWYASVTGIALGATAWWTFQAWWTGTPPVREDRPRSGAERKADRGAPESQPRSRGFVGHARLVGLLTLCSRFFGLARDWSLAWAFGFTGLLDAFVVAFMIPNLFRRLFGEGALAVAFIPQYSRLRREAGDRDPRQFARLVLGRISAVLAGICAVGIAALLVLQFAAPLDDRGLLTARLTMITLPYMIFVCIAAMLGAMLQVHGRFGPPAAAPIILNVFIIAGAVIGVRVLPGYLSPRGAIQVVAGAVVAAGVVQVAWELLALRQANVLISLRRRLRLADASHAVKRAWSALMKQWLVMLFALAVFQINTLMDALIAMFFSGAPGETMMLFGRTVRTPMETGAVAVISAASRLYEFPLGVFAIAVATAIFPALANAADDRDRLSALLRQGLRLTVYIGLPASIGLCLVGHPLARTIYYGVGAIEADDARRVAWVLLGYAPAVWAYSMNHVLTRTFYAREDAITPARVAAGMVGLNLALNLLLIWPLGAAGLALSTAVCAIGQTVVLGRLVRRHADHPVDGEVIGSWARTVAGSVIMAAVVIAVLRPFDVAALGWVQVLGLLLAAVAAGGATFAAVSLLTGQSEPRWLLSRT